MIDSCQFISQNNFLRSLMCVGALAWGFQATCVRTAIILSTFSHISEGNGHKPAQLRRDRKMNKRNIKRPTIYIILTNP
jgi:hypothetical protein